MALHATQARCAWPPHAQARFIKLCKESGLVGRQLTTTDCDLIFAKAKERSVRKVTFEQVGLGLLAPAVCTLCCTRYYAACER